MIRGRILSRYLARQYFLWFAAFLLGLTGIIYLFEVAELLRRATTTLGATFPVILRMGAYKLPDTVERILPFVVLFSSLFTFWRLTKSRELIVARAAGVSAWQFLMPALTVTFAFGWLNVMGINPIGTFLTGQYKEMETRYLSRAPSLELTGAGLWLRQNEGSRRYLLHADRVETDPLTLKPLIVFIYDNQDHYVGRLDAPEAILRDGYWDIRDAWYNGTSDAPIKHEAYKLPTTLTLARIQESMESPNTISFWRLPGFIETLEIIGLPTAHHVLQFQRLLAEPFLLCAMVLFAAAFSLRLDRQGGILNAMMAAMVIGSAIFAANNIVTALGTNQTLPAWMAAWSIPLAALVAGLATLLHREDG